VPIAAACRHHEGQDAARLSHPFQVPSGRFQVGARWVTRFHGACGSERRAPRDFQVPSRLSIASAHVYRAASTLTLTLTHTLSRARIASSARLAVRAAQRRARQLRPLPSFQPYESARRPRT
jgi:hypothetical protein